MSGLYASKSGLDVNESATGTSQYTVARVTTNAQDNYLLSDNV